MGSNLAIFSQCKTFFRVLYDFYHMYIKLFLNSDFDHHQYVTFLCRFQNAKYLTALAIRFALLFVAHFYVSS